MIDEDFVAARIALLEATWQDTTRDIVGRRAHVFSDGDDKWALVLETLAWEPSEGKDGVVNVVQTLRARDIHLLVLRPIKHADIVFELRRERDGRTAYVPQDVRFLDAVHGTVFVPPAIAKKEPSPSALLRALWKLEERAPFLAGRVEVAAKVPKGAALVMSADDVVDVKKLAPAAASGKRVRLASRPRSRAKR